MTAEETQNYEKLNADYDGLSRKIDRVERVEKIEADQRQHAGDPDVGRGNSNPQTRQARPQHHARHRRAPALAMQGWCRSQMGLAVKKRHTEACRLVRVDPNQRTFRTRLPTQCPSGANCAAPAAKA